VFIVLLLYVWFVCVLFVPSVLWYCWLGLFCINRLPYNLYCVDGDVKHCSIQSIYVTRILYMTACITQQLLLLARQNCTKFYFGWGSSGQLTARSSDLLDLRGLLLMTGRESKGRGKGREKMKCFTTTLIPSGLPSRILTCTELKGHWLSFVLVSGYVC